MDREQIVESVEHLHAALAGAKRIDPETRAKLRSLTDDIDRLLDEESETAPEEIEPVASGLRDLVLKFEAEHPQLSIAVGKVADALAAKSGLPVALWDERLTTARALRTVRELEGSTRGRKEDVDALAATVLLQHYLDAQRAR